jgi:hypothetical protein
MNSEDKKTIHRCDCGHFHETNEIETITLKIRKGKHCSLESALVNLFPHFDDDTANRTSNSTVPVVQPTPATMQVEQHSTVAQLTTPVAQPVSRYAVPGYDPADLKVVKLLNPEEKAKFLKESAIPPEFARQANPLIKPGIGIPSGDPNFELYGAKEIRRI